MKKILIVLAALVLAGFGFWFLTERKSPATIGSDSGQIKTPHFETSTPAHGDTLAAPPVNVVIDFNFDLALPSSIAIFKKGIDEPVYQNGEMVIDESKVAMRVNAKQEMPDGDYIVKYTACWPDQTCHDGRFEFAIDRTLVAAFIDLRGKPEVAIRMSEIRFQPMDIRISPGTTILWTNDDDVTHYVNTDSHPAHTYFPSQNSRAIEKGQTYTATFTDSGIYPYHCSAHASVMTGSILVE
ncbi:MAG: copper resistance protein CopC [Candidatus Kerfeldbacteria bacterium]|nr:copper resistance protein CopC [Candidatus Kerfeldbacteria bacterium]